MRQERLMRFAGQHVIIIGIAFAMSCACTQKAPPKIEETRNFNATLLCDGTRTVMVRFTPFAAHLESDGASADLTQQPSADGLLYVGNGHGLHTRGDEATWTDAKGIRHRCRDRTAENR
jgi:hypothetical protein